MDSTPNGAPSPQSAGAIDALSEKDFTRIVEATHGIVRSAARQFVDDEGMVDDIAQQFSCELLEWRRKRTRKA